ncbi:hypothetical protein H6P81_010031 [Aristolochia fimbriata]|uniref:Pentatricopeptide repeat-containing protein n=1 Tax=Aristolochia fimbriata TaxID=158543 RepID=A0AAV7ENR3_ARIFI|nr:hypothetical protein H6P81_010031 [Aristolochia fimbriata]
MSLPTIQASLLHCIRNKSYWKTRQVHSQIVLNFLSSDIYLANLIIESYFKCGQPQLAYLTFDQMPERDSVSWGQIISSYSKCKQHDKAIEYFHMMGQQGCSPNRSCLLSALNACSSLSMLMEGKQLHSQIIKRISPVDVIVGNILIDFYSKCGELSESRKAFDDILVKDLVSWTSLLSGYCQSGLATEAWGMFTFMMEQGMGFSYHAFSVAAKACAEINDVKCGEGLHSLIVKTGFESHVFVASALLDMYSKHGKITSGRHIFDSMDEPNIVSWTSIITGYVQNDEGEEALKLFRRQTQLGILPDAFSISSILAACANIPALEYGKQLHCLNVKLGFEFQTFAGNSLLGMYSRCGCLEDARAVHASIGKPNVITWTAMIAGYAQHGRGTEALEIFHQMRETKVKPNAITLLAILSACSRSGLIEEGIKYFQSMGKDYDIEAREEHFTCMVDLLARAGRVKEAEEFMRGMPFEPSASAWGALLSGYMACGDLKMASKCAEELLRLEPSSASNIVTLANMYASLGKWEEMGRIRGLMKEKSLKKESGYSWIEIGEKLSVFGVRDQLHPQSDVIYEVLHLLSIEEGSLAVCQLPVQSTLNLPIDPRFVSYKWCSINQPLKLLSRSPLSILTSLLIQSPVSVDKCEVTILSSRDTELNNSHFLFKTIFVTFEHSQQKFPTPKSVSSTDYSQASPVCNTSRNLLNPLPRWPLESPVSTARVCLSLSMASAT